MRLLDLAEVWSGKHEERECLESFRATERKGSDCFCLGGLASFLCAFLFAFFRDDLEFESWKSKSRVRDGKRNRENRLGISSTKRGDMESKSKGKDI